MERILPAIYTAVVLLVYALFEHVLEASFYTTWAALFIIAVAGIVFGKKGEEGDTEDDND